MPESCSSLVAVPVVCTCHLVTTVLISADSALGLNCCHQLSPSTDQCAGTLASSFPLPDPTDLLGASHVRFEDLRADLVQLTRDLEGADVGCIEPGCELVDATNLGTKSLHVCCYLPQCARSACRLWCRPHLLTCCSHSRAEWKSFWNKVLHVVWLHGVGVAKLHGQVAGVGVSKLHGQVAGVGVFMGARIAQ